MTYHFLFVFFFSSRRRHTRWTGDWSSDVCSSDLTRQFSFTAATSWWPSGCQSGASRCCAASESARMTSRTSLPLRGIGLFLVIVLALVVLKAPPDGLERGQLSQFLGRFHPLVVHLPIALVLLVAALECAG